MNTPDYQDWLPGRDASRRYGLPIELIAEGMARGQVRITVINNEPLVNRADVNALALLLKTGGDCHGCE